MKKILTSVPFSAGTAALPPGALALSPPTLPDPRSSFDPTDVLTSEKPHTQGISLVVKDTNENILISPGCSQLPPSTRPAWLMVECGAWIGWAQAISVLPAPGVRSSPVSQRATAHTRKGNNVWDTTSVTVAERIVWIQGWSLA